MTPDLPAGLDVDYELTRFVRRVRSKALQRLVEFHPKLDYGSFLFLIAICDAPEGIRGSALAENLRVHKSTASRAIATLVKLGLVERTTDPDDGRAQLLVADPKAAAAMHEYRKTGHARLESILSDWNPAEVVEFARNLARLNDAVEELPDE